jgi:hypothetical protein
MNKLIQEGKVAVLYSPGFGAGWYSWHGIAELLFDPVVVVLVLSKQDDYKERILQHCESTYGEEYYGGIYDLTVSWVPEGTKFVITEYDGNEGIDYMEDFVWQQA